jgi:hypothetical protein
MVSIVVLVGVSTTYCGIHIFTLLYRRLGGRVDYLLWHTYFHFVLSGETLVEIYLWAEEVWRQNDDYLPGQLCSISCTRFAASESIVLASFGLYHIPTGSERRQFAGGTFMNRWGKGCNPDTNESQE